MEIIRSLIRLAMAGLSGRMEIYNPLSGAAATRHAGQNTYKVNGGSGLGVTCDGDYTQTTAVNAFRILASSGNLASGTVRVYGSPTNSPA